jgi:hypothetical protein
MIGEMCVIDRTGDTKVVWNSDSPDEVETAKATFDRLRKKGYIAYRVKRNGDPGEVMAEFDPAAESIILAPAVAGG